MSDIYPCFIIIIIWLYSPSRALASPFWGFLKIPFCRAGLLVQRPTPNLEDQVSLFMTPGDRMAQLYPQALGAHFSRLLRHAWVTVGLFFNPGHHAGNTCCIPQLNQVEMCLIEIHICVCFWKSGGTKYILT
jgi:hypothetical protein